MRYWEEINRVQYKPSTHPHRSRAKLMQSAEVYSLQMAAKEFHKNQGPKISKLNGGYLANAMLIFN